MENPPKSFLYASIDRGEVGRMLLDFFLPAHCAACDAPGRDMCDRCIALLASAPALLRGAQDGTPAVTALGPYEGVFRAAVLALKFRGARSAGSRLGRWLAPKLIWPFQAVVPVPLHVGRFRERGYNQALEIARGIAAVSRAPIVENALVRTRATEPQSALDLERRKENVVGAFGAGPRIDDVTGLRVLIVDDVVTTGATARACAAALLAGGARTCYLAVVALRL